MADGSTLCFAPLSTPAYAAARFAGCAIAIAQVIEVLCGTSGNRSHQERAEDRASRGAIAERAETRLHASQSGHVHLWDGNSIESFRNGQIQRCRQILTPPRLVRTPSAQDCLNDTSSGSVPVVWRSPPMLVKLAHEQQTRPRGAPTRSLQACTWLHLARSNNRGTLLPIPSRKKCTPGNCQILTMSVQRKDTWTYRWIPVNRRHGISL